MTREEAAKRWEWVIENFNDLSVYLWPDQRQELLASIALLRGTQPDPDTGLVPCGCGGKAKIWPSDPTQFTHVITDYEVGCTECAMTTGWVRGKQENAMKVWNTAMGWKGGAEGLGGRK